MDGVAFWVVGMLVHYNYYLSNGSASKSSHFNDWDVVNLMIIYASYVYSKISMSEWKA